MSAAHGAKGAPGFLLLIGAPKSGTSTLAAWLGRRFDIAGCREKEPRFFTDFATRTWRGPFAETFARSIIADEAEYLAAFDNAGEARWRLDASTDYLWHPPALERIRDWARDHPVKLIAVLRDPVARAVSEYQHTLRDGYQHCSLGESLEREAERFRAGFHPLFYHRRRSAYFERLKAYQAAFGDDLMLLDYADLRDPARLMRRIESFLGLSVSDVDYGERRNASYIYHFDFTRKLLRSRTLARAARSVVPRTLRGPVRRVALKAVTTQYVPTDAELAQLAALLRDDMEKCMADQSIPTGSWTLR